MQRVILIVLALTALAAPILAFGADADEPAVYDLKVNIAPEAGRLTVRGSVEVPLTASAPDFKFALHETFAITKLTIDGKQAKFAYVPMQGEFLLPASRDVVVTLPARPSKGRVRMDIEYGGQMKVLPEFGASPDLRHSLDDQINARMVELAGYSSWYPQFVFGNPIKVELAVSLPKGWTHVCSGKKLDERIENGRILTRWSSPRDMDIVVVASPSYKQRSFDQGALHVAVYHTRMPEKFVAGDGVQIANSLKFYTAQLGDPNIPGGSVSHVFSPKKKGQGKAGFARPGMIVTSEGITMDALARDPKFSLFQGVAHEIAHYWWNFGVEQGDWVNEAFAEYFSAVAVQKLASEEEFRAVMADYRKQVGGLPPDAPSLATVPRWSNFVVRYYKGALMLDDFRQVMGDDKFFAASHEFYQTYTGKPTGTTEFRSFWKAKLGENAATVDTWLESTGSVPQKTKTQS